MLDKIKTLMLEYSDIYEEAWKTVSFKHPIASMVRNDIAQDFKELDFIDPNMYLVKASCGTGRFTAVPWIAIFDKRITETAQKGVYIVYLLNKDTKELYLTLNQAVTGLSISELKNKAKEIQKLLGIDGVEPIITGSDAYDSGCILSKKYTLKDLDNYASFITDLKYFLGKYEQYQSTMATSTWWPSQEEYPLNLNKEDWVKYITEIELPKHPSPMKMLKGMLELGGEASCKLLSDTYGGHPSVYAGCAMNLGRRVKKFFDLPSCMDGEQERYFPFPFVGKYQGSIEDNYIYRIRPELKAALQEIDLSSINPNYEEEHKIGTFDSWEIVDENTAIKHCDKSFFEHNGSGIPKDIIWFFDAGEIESGETRQIKIIYNDTEYAGRISREAGGNSRVRIFWNSFLGNIFRAFNSENAVAEFARVNNDVYNISFKGNEKIMTIKEKISTIKKYIANKGFNYEEDLIENFYLSLKSKPFVILAGTSGTGKTRLVKLFAEAIDAKLKLVPVRPDWSDSADLFGYTDLSNKFQPGAIIDFIKQAESDKNTPYFICLDEMNLARVEYYLSDFLSIIETRDRKENGIIETDPIIEESYYKTEEACDKYGRICIPDNLYIIGTVNMDETTFPFSKKVLDRANTIEFSFVDLMSKIVVSSTVDTVKMDNAFLKTEYLYLHECEDKELIDSVCFNLEEINQILAKANLHVGYRVRDEISFYMMNNKNTGLLSEDVAFDHEIMQKILPRIQGSSVAIKGVLSELFTKCGGDYSVCTGATSYEQMNSYINEKACKYPNSSKKIAFMMRRYEEDGFTSYWL